MNQALIAENMASATLPKVPLSHGKTIEGQLQALETLLASETFASAHRLRDVLRFLLQSIEDGTTSAITEQNIGQAVFGRRPGYNASEDNIVRVTVRHLRTRLEEFYKTEGQSESIALVIPKGKYVPMFVTRSAGTIEEPKAGPPPDSVIQSEGQLHKAVPPSEPPVSRVKRWNYIIWWTTLASVLALGICFCLGYMVRGVASEASSSPNGLLGRLCGKDAQLLIVTVDANLQAYRSIFGKQVSLNEYVDRTYGQLTNNSADPRIANAMRFSVNDDDTNLSSALIASSIRIALPDRDITVKQPHGVSMRDFQNQQDIVLLGGPWSNPWGQLFENHMNFKVVPLENSPSTSKLVNAHPLPGEAAEYIPHSDNGLNISYIRIAILSGFNKGSHIFLLGATSNEALEAGGKFLLSPDSLNTMLQRFSVKSATKLPPLEVVLEASGFDSVPSNYRIVASRILQY